MGRFLIACLLLLATAALPARAQEGESRATIELRNQMLELRHDMDALRQQVAGMASGQSGYGSSALGGYRPPPPPPTTGGGSNDMTATLLDRVNQLEDQLRRLQGRIDEIDNARQRQGADMEKAIGDIDFKLGIMPPGGAAPTTPDATSNATPGGPPGGTAANAVPPPPPPPPAPAVHRTPELAMQEGNAALARRDYATAEAAAKEVLAFPKSPRATDAQFLLAQALAGRKDYAAAAIAYDDVYKRAKKGVHAQDSLLGLAASLNAYGEKRAACATLEQLRAEFPTPRADLREQAAGVRQRAGCR